MYGGFRWGVEGDEGYTELSAEFATYPTAVKAFEQRFKLKTANHWSDRARFRPQSFHFQLQPAEGTALSPREHPAPPPPRPACLSAASSSSSSAAATEEKVVRLVYMECREGETKSEE